MKWMKFLIPFIALLFAFNSCKKNELNTDSSVMLEFSADTMIFDTVFTTIGTTTEFLKIYNNEDQPIEVSNISLARGSSSQFRINVDGVAGISFDNIEIPAEDSLFIFVEATIDPNNINSPLIVTDSILFQTNGNLQDVDLVAWGQDAHFYYGQQFSPGFPDIVCLEGDCETNTCGDFFWPNDKPYVVYGYLVVDSCQKLIIEQGTQVHFHQGSGLWVYEYGQIEAIGSLDEPIVFQGDRPESVFDEIPGQWDRIWINHGNAGQDNVFEHCVIKNNFLGIQAEPLVLTEDDLFGPGAENKLILRNVITRNNSGAGLLLKNYNVQAENCLFANAGQSTVAINGEGEYNFNFCTFGNYWSFGTRNTPSFFVSNTYVDQLQNLQVRSIENSQVTNSIIYGNGFDEIGFVFDNSGGALSNIIFDKVLMKVDETDVSDDNVFTDILINQNPQFVEPSDGDFHLLLNSPVIDRPNSPFAPFIGIDIEENSRIGNGDWGCYEYQE
ncbi:MAG: hypothetical protein HKN39_06595 [Flavobacteriales bacterium]|nr:hypothetical protein [Flavobacteriales bacterium]